MKHLIITKVHLWIDSAVQFMIAVGFFCSLESVNSLSFFVALLFWQIITGIVILSTINWRSTERFALISIEVAFVVVVFLSSFSSSGAPYGLFMTFFLATLVVMPIYWIVTITDIKKIRSHKGSFLPHTGF